MGLTNTSNHIGNQSTNERWRFKLVLVERKLPQLPNNAVAGKSAVKTAHNSQCFGVILKIHCAPCICSKTQKMTL